jgi:DNA-binding SARP family transcriptional activator
MSKTAEFDKVHPRREDRTAGVSQAGVAPGHGQAEASEAQTSGRRNGAPGLCHTDLRAESKDTAIGTSARGAEPLYAGYQALTTDVIEDVLVVAQQKENRLFFSSVLWDLGHDLMDRQEYALAAECFRQISRSAAGFTDRFSIEAARVAGQLCVALGRGQLDVEESREIRETLRRSWIQLSHQEVSAAAAALAAHTGGQAPDARHLPSDSPANRATGAKARSASPPVEARTTDGRAAPIIDQETPPDGTVTVPHHLEVHFFGRFEILSRGRTLPLGHHGKALAILRYLVANVPRPVTQDYLMGWLWPESDLKKARWSLNSAVCALRKVLGGAETLAVSPIRVVLEGGYYCLSPNVRVYSDRDAFDTRYASGQQFEKDGRIREASAEYEKAIELYWGDFLVEDLYEEWTSIERERLVTSYTDMLKRLAVYYMRNGRCRESIRACYRILEKDRCDEDTHRLLMECFVRLGQRARALRQYRLCEQALRNEYDATLSPETRAFYTSLSKGGLR